MFAKEIVAEFCVEMPVSYFCTYPLLFSLLVVFASSHGQLLGKAMCLSIAIHYMGEHAYHS